MGCTGACCAAFPLSHSLADLWRDQSVQDGLQVLAMVVPITIDEAGARLSAVDGQPPTERDRQYFRCVHWDETTRLCRSYEQRPAMCRDYPYGRPCDHGCDCRGAVRTPLSQVNWDGDGA